MIRDSTDPMFAGLPQAHFVEVATDVPWEFVNYGAPGNRAAERHYETMTLGAIAALPVIDFVAPNARLWFWITGPFLAAGAHLPIMRAWGFEPTAMAFVWVKPTRRQYQQGRFHFAGLDDDAFRMNLGHTTRQNAEYVILGRRGRPAARTVRTATTCRLDGAGPGSPQV